MADAPIRVLLADAGALRRTVLARRLQDDGHRVAEASGRAAAMAAARAEPAPEVLVWGLPRWQEALSRLTAERPALPVLVLSGLRERDVGPLALRAGAAGVVARRTALDALPEAVRTAAAGRRFLSAELAGAFAEAVAEGRDLGSEGALSGLSLREAQVVRLVGAGMLRAEIAEHMAVAPSTVTTYQKRALTKLGLRSTRDLVRFALRHGLVSNEAPERR